MMEAAIVVAGFAPNLRRRLEAGVESGLLQGLHAVAMSRGGRLVLERYYDGEDEALGSHLIASTSARMCRTTCAR